MVMAASDRSAATKMSNTGYCKFEDTSRGLPEWRFQILGAHYATVQPSTQNACGIFGCPLPIGGIQFGMPPMGRGQNKIDQPGKNLDKIFSSYQKFHQNGTNRMSMQDAMYQTQMQIAFPYRKVLLGLSLFIF